MKTKKERAIMPAKMASNSLESSLTRKKFIEMAGLATLGTVLAAAANAQSKTAKKEPQKRYPGQALHKECCVGVSRLQS